MSRYIKFFEEINSNDIDLVGGKNVSLGVLYKEFKNNGIKVPNGFAITADAFKDFIGNTKIKSKIVELLKDLDNPDIVTLKKISEEIKKLILNIDMPEQIETEIAIAYKKLCDQYEKETDVAVRSSATLEDLKNASFAGQQDTYLNIRGVSSLIEHVKKCFASLYNDRAISYRLDRGFKDSEVYISVGVQKMVRSDLACSGVMFTVDTETGFEDAIIITASYGLGESIVEGSTNPDEYVVYKWELQQHMGLPIIKKKLGSKDKKKIYRLKEEGITSAQVTQEEQDKFVLKDDEIKFLAGLGCKIEDYYGYTVDIEWGKDGINGEFYILQARPETVCSIKDKAIIEHYVLDDNEGKFLVSGQAIGQKISRGNVNIVKDNSESEKFKKGDILVTEMTDPSWEPIMKLASGIVTDKGGRTCHAAIVSRELEVPAIVGSEMATKILEQDQKITICCAKGDIGYVYEGQLRFHIEKEDIENLKRPKTKIMLNIGNPNEAFRFSRIPNDGVGLARIEFIILNNIKIHPNALLGFSSMDHNTTETINMITRGYDNKVKFYINKLAEGVAQIASAFYPKDVIVRMSDFKTNEYADLVGGRVFEHSENNPMIGFRGASRYLHKNFSEAFKLECRAMKIVRDEMGFNNVKLMIPFCRTVEEGKNVIDRMKGYELVQGKNELEIYMMVEIPSNVILLEEFADIFDGFSIGSNDLTQLVLGLDRDSEKVAYIFNERNSAVKKMIQEAIMKAKKKGKKIGICGQAPSDYPDFAEFLIGCGIDSISLNPDSVLQTTKRVICYEHKQQEKEVKEVEKMHIQEMFFTEYRDHYKKVA
ncbi:MAG: phosphoenolpyruvate synthase [bacterium]